MPSSNAEPKPFLTFARFRFHLQVLTLMILPPYKGAIFRGVFGAGLHRLVCMTRQRDCNGCLLRQNCLYIILFEPQPPPSFADARKFSQAPRPYVIIPPLTSRQSFHPGDSINFELVLIGPAIEALPYCIQAFEAIGRRGLGPGQGEYRLVRVEQLRGSNEGIIYDANSRLFIPPVKEKSPRILAQDQGITEISLNLLTPLRLKEKGKLATELSSDRLFVSLAQRLSILKDFYGNRAMSSDSPSGGGAEHNSLREYMLERARNVIMRENEVYWYDWQRHSQRQGQKMNLGGLKGRVTISGELGLLLPYLRLGEVVNIGQGTSFGLGRFTLETY